MQFISNSQYISKVYAITEIIDDPQHYSSIKGDRQNIFLDVIILTWSVMWTLA